MPIAKVDRKTVKKKGMTKILTSSPYKNEFVTPEERVEAKKSRKSQKATIKCGIKAKKKKFPNISAMTARRMTMMMPSPLPIKSGIRSPPKSESSAPDTANGLRIHVRMSTEMTMMMDHPHLP
jgi:hypothetical protein